MLEPQGPRHGSVVKAGHYLVLAAGAVVAAIVVFAVLSFVVGIVVEIVKIAAVVALVAGAVWLVSRARRHRRG